MSKLFYVMGASGCGKDSFIQTLREDPRCRLLFAHRYITRPMNLGNENHLALSEREFQQRITRGLFSMHWQANGLHYGIGKEIAQWLAQGEPVIMNGSRAYFSQAEQLFSDVIVPVWLSVEPELLRQRLVLRGRDSAEEIQLRLERAIQYQQLKPTNAIEVDNSGELQASVDHFLDALTRDQRFINQGPSNPAKISAGVEGEEL